MDQHYADVLKVLWVGTLGLAFFIGPIVIYRLAKPRQGPVKVGLNLCCLFGLICVILAIANAVRYQIWR